MYLITLKYYPPQNTDDNYNVEHVIGSVSESDFSDQYNCKLEYGSASLTSENSEFKKIGKCF